MNTASPLVYEQPLTERVRSFLRLEFLFNEYHFHAACDGPYAVRASLRALQDVLALTARSDLKSEVIKEIQDQQAAIVKAPQQLVGLEAKDAHETLREALKGVQRLPSHFVGATLRAHDFLDSLAKRTAIPGGAAPFDMPALHRWLHESDHKMHADAAVWFAHFAPYQHAISACLSVLRHAGRAESHVTTSSGVYLHMPQSAHQLLRVQLAQPALYPEISAGRHRYSLRFMHQPSVEQRATPVAAPVPFTLQCCAMGA